MKKMLLALLLAASVPANAQDRVSKYDLDKDGKVSYMDLTAFCEVSEKLFLRADLNNDGFLSNSEMRTAKGYLLTKCTKE